MVIFNVFAENPKLNIFRNSKFLTNEIQTKFETFKRDMDEIWLAPRFVHDDLRGCRPQHLRPRGDQISKLRVNILIVMEMQQGP